MVGDEGVDCLTLRSMLMGMDWLVTGMPFSLFTMFANRMPHALQRVVRGQKRYIKKQEEEKEYPKEKEEKK